MEKTTRWHSTTARRLAQESLRDAGRRKDVAKALKRSPATITKEVTERAHPELRAAFEVLLDLNCCPDTTGRAFADAVAAAQARRDVMDAPTEMLIARGMYLLDRENELDGVEDCASMRTTREHAEALRRHASHACELAAIEDELLSPERGRTDLLALYRSRS